MDSIKLFNILNTNDFVKSNFSIALQDNGFIYIHNNKNDGEINIDVSGKCMDRYKDSFLYASYNFMSVDDVIDSLKYFDKCGKLNPDEIEQ